MDTSSDHNSESRSGETSYWVRRDNKIKGPRSRQRVITAINERRLSPTDEISLTENGPWFLLEKWMNHDCNDEVLNILEGPTIIEPSSEVEDLPADDYATFIPEKTADTTANLRRSGKNTPVVTLHEKNTWGDWAFLFFLTGPTAIAIGGVPIACAFAAWSKTAGFLISILIFSIFSIIVFAVRKGIASGEIRKGSRLNDLNFILVCFMAFGIFIGGPLVLVFTVASNTDWSAENWYLVNWTPWPLSILTILLLLVSQYIVWRNCDFGDESENQKIKFIAGLILFVFWMGWQHIYIRGERERYWESKLIRTESKLRAMERYNNRGYDDTGRPWYK